MGRDILDFSADVPKDRLGLPRRQSAEPASALPASSSAQTDFSSPNAVRTTSARPSARPQRQDRPVLNALVLVLSLAFAAAAGFYLWSTAGRASLEVNGLAIANGSEILADAEELMAEAAAADGAPLAADARCHFAPGDDPQVPTVLCGPVWLGVSPAEEPWLQTYTSYTAAEESVTGQLEGIVGTAAGETQKFVRPDKQDAAEPGEPQALTAGIRLFDGSLLLNPDEMLAGAEDALALAVAEAEESGEGSLTLAEDWACYLRQGPEVVRELPVVESAAHCGPARTVESKSESIWVPVGVRLQPGPTFGTVNFESAGTNSLRPRELAEGASLIRADGAVAPAPDVDSVDRPPVPADFVAIVSYALPVRSAASGLLLTARARLELTAIDRVKQIGSGARSFTAPEGHDLVVASIAPQENSIPLRGVITVDGNERLLPNIRNVSEGATIIVAVPETATAVGLVAENSGRPQTISLLDGSLADGFPLALYRSDLESTDSFGVRIEMPAGEAVLVNGAISLVSWLASDEDREWLPVGTAHLVMEFEDWNVDRPCCDVAVESVLASFTVVHEETVYADRREDSTGRPSTRPPRFELPEDLEAVTARMDVVVTFTQDDGEPQTVTGVAEVELVFP